MTRSTAALTSTDDQGQGALAAHVNGGGVETFAATEMSAGGGGAGMPTPNLPTSPPLPRGGCGGPAPSRGLGVPAYLPPDGGSGAEWHGGGGGGLVRVATPGRATVGGGGGGTKPKPYGRGVGIEGAAGAVTYAVELWKGGGGASGGGGGGGGGGIGGCDSCGGASLESPCARGAVTTEGVAAGGGGEGVWARDDSRIAHAICSASDGGRPFITDPADGCVGARGLKLACDGGVQVACVGGGRKVAGGAKAGGGEADKGEGKNPGGGSVGGVGGGGTIADGASGAVGGAAGGGRRGGGMT
eukprot:CAMPEP_0115854248 /NCGR_PEP_ID=MMETSP0287-20121206/13930_1 /TAXON_ID=412157 /ORGANISM="Chrysochromulina rotalis, Strain UIO044" /LENGTH=299 /DNA_ID=CAMNT_0003308367 /DNA_START=165 /DNA_END=1061 /DNA_ORIENTATION=-